MDVVRTGAALAAFVLFQGLSLLSASVAAARPLGALPDSEVQSRLASLQFAPYNGKSRIVSVGGDSSCLKTKQTLDVTDLVTRRADQYEFRLQRPVVDQPVPVVIIVPNIEGVTLIETSIADHLCGQGIASIIADVNDVSDPAHYPAWGAEDRNSREAIIALRTFIDFAKRTPQFDGNRIGMIGISLGAITTSMMAGIEPDALKAVVTVVGAGNMPHILTYSNESRVSNWRNSRMRLLGWTNPAQYEDKEREVLKFDALYFAKRVNTRKVMMVMAENDTLVPYAAQAETFQRFERPSQLLFTGGHVDTIIQLTYLYMNDVDNFLHRKLHDPANLSGLSNDDAPLRKVVALP
jgi:dienelactone hydrolase